MSAATMTTFLPYTLTLRAPAIATAQPGDANSAATRPFIPGGAIRGAVAARLLAEGEPADGEVFRDLILTGAVRYLHAYPEIDGQRAMPAPLSWRSDKRRTDRALDLAAFSGQVSEDEASEDLAELWPREALVSLGAPFVAPSAASGRQSVAAPEIDARLHQQRDRVKGRPWLEQSDGQETPHGAIFAYEYLEPQQVFRGAIQLHLRAVWPAGVERLGALRERYTQRIKELFDGRPILVGRSRRAGYGGDAEVKLAADTPAEYDDASDLLTDGVGNGHLFRMMLVSAYVGRHPETGQLDPAALAHELRQRGLKADVERRFWSFETVGSFNQKWRLEVPQATAVSAGSVLVLRAQEPIPLAALRGIEREGLGERRVDGLGRVLFLRHEGNTAAFALRRDPHDAALLRPLASSRAVSRSVPEALAFVERRIVLTSARLELDRIAADLAGRATKLPASSLLGRIRSLFRAVHDEPTARCALQNLRIWCGEQGSGALKHEARNKLCACRVGGSTLFEWLQALTQSGANAEWLRLVDATGNASTLTGLADRHHLTTPTAAGEILKSHAAELSAHLIDAVLAMVARTKRGTDR